MWNFLIIMAIQLVLDIIILSIWTALFRFRHEIINVDVSHSLFLSHFLSLLLFRMKIII